MCVEGVCVHAYVCPCVSTSHPFLQETILESTTAFDHVFPSPVNSSLLFKCNSCVDLGFLKHLEKKVRQTSLPVQFTFLFPSYS